MLKLHAIYFTLPNMQVNKYLYDIGRIVLRPISNYTNVHLWQFKMKTSHFTKSHPLYAGMSNCWTICIS